MLPNTPYTYSVTAGYRYTFGGVTYLAESPKTYIQFTTLAAGNYKGYVLNGGSKGGLGLHYPDNSVDVKIGNGNIVYSNRTATMKYKITSMKCSCSNTRYLISYGRHAEIYWTVNNKDYILIVAHLEGFQPTIWNYNPAYHERHDPQMSSSQAKEYVGSANISTEVSGTVNVTAGDIIGYTGNAGNSYGNHLHCGITENGGAWAGSVDDYASFLEAYDD